MLLGRKASNQPTHCMGGGGGEGGRPVPVSVFVPVRQGIQMTGDENGVGGRVRFLAYWLVVIGVFFNFGFEGRNGL